MTNAIIDAITWDPNNQAASIRNLQTQLNLLQTDWLARLQQLKQINRAGPVTESDWLALADDPDKVKSLYLHFDPTALPVPQFMGSWRPVSGQIIPSDSYYDIGRREQLFLHIPGDHVTASNNAAVNIYNVSINVRRKAMIHGFHALMHATLSATSGGNVTFDYNVKWDATNIFSNAYLRFSINQTGTVSSPYSPTYIEWIYGPVTSLGSHTFVLELDGISHDGASGSVRCSELAPLPNIAHSSGAPQGHIAPGSAIPTPSYLELIYVH